MKMITEAQKHRLIGGRVYTAKSYRSCSLGSLARTSYMYLRQFQFPDTYDGRDKHMTADSDRCFSWDYEHVRRCFTQHTGTGELGFESWVLGATDQQIMGFIQDILKADSGIRWTGFRAMGSVHLGNGCPVWTLELFAKHPDSDTPVYTGPDAPNVKKDIDPGLRGCYCAR